jgi:hypothetical protein
MRMIDIDSRRNEWVISEMNFNMIMMVFKK